MKKMLLALAALFVLGAPAAFSASTGEHDMHHAMGNVAHEEVVNGVKATFTVQTMADAMKAMGMQMPKGVTETHHISVVFKDIKSGKALTDGQVRIKVLGPDKKEQIKDMAGMQGHFGADVEMRGKGKYGIMCKFLMKNSGVRQVTFWHVIK